MLRLVDTQEILDTQLKRLYFLTESIKQLESVIDTSNERTLNVLLETLNEYNSVADETRRLLTKYFQERTATGKAIDINYGRIYKKLKS